MDFDALAKAALAAWGISSIITTILTVTLIKQQKDDLSPTFKIHPPEDVWTQEDIAILRRLIDEALGKPAAETVDVVVLK